MTADKGAAAPYPSLTVQNHDTLAEVCNKVVNKHRYIGVPPDGGDDEGFCLCGDRVETAYGFRLHFTGLLADALIASGVVAVRKPLPDELRDLAKDMIAVANYVEQQP